MINNIEFIEVLDINGIKTFINIEGIIGIRENITVRHNGDNEVCNEIICISNGHIYTYELVSDIMVKIQKSIKKPTNSRAVGVSDSNTANVGSVCLFE